MHWREFAGGPVVRTWCFHWCGPGLIPARGTKIPQAVKKQTNKQNALEFHEIYLLEYLIFSCLKFIF